MRPPIGGSVLWVVCLCQFMVILDASIINVALPSIARDLHFSDAGLAWVVNGYLLPFAGLMLVAGRLADLIGPRRLLPAGVVLFSAASLVGGLASTPELLVSARIIQGVGAAVIAPTAIAAINLEYTDASRRIQALAACSAAGGLGGSVGAIVGGILTSALSWRWVLLINVPIGILLVVLARKALRPVVRHRGSIDVLGAATATAGLAAVTFGVMQAPDHPWTAVPVLAPLVSGVTLLLSFVFVEHRVQAPMLPPELFRARPVQVGNLTMLMLGGISIGLWYFTSLTLQNVLGYSAIQSGLAQTPAAVMFMVVARRAGQLIAQQGVARALLLGSVPLALGFGWLALSRPDSSYLAGLLGPTLLIGAGIGITFPTVMAVATSDIPRGFEGVAGGVATTAQQVGAAVSLALFTVAANTQIHQTPTQLAAGYSRVYLLALLLALGVGALALSLPKSVAGAVRNGDR